MSPASSEWGEREPTGREATADEALSSVFATMRTVGRREGERLTPDQAELIARSAAAAARQTSDGPVGDRSSTVVALAGAPVLDEATLLADDLSPGATAARHRYRARLGLLAAAAAIVAVALAVARPTADEVSVSSAARPGAVLDRTTAVPAPPPSDTAATSAPASAVEAAPAPTATLTTTTEPPAEDTSHEVVADTSPVGAPVESTPTTTSTTAPATSPPSSASQPAPQVIVETMTLPVGGAGTVAVGIVDNTPVLVEVVPADGWTYAVAEDQAWLAVQFASQDGTATFEIRTGAASFELLIDPEPAGAGGYTRTRMVDLSPAGAVRVVHSGGQLRSIEAGAGAGWTLQSETTGSDRLDLGFVAAGNWIPVGYLLSIGTLELVIQAG